MSIVDQDTGLDEFYPYGGTDILYGGAGDDILEGGKDQDFLWGGLDSDTFVYNTGDGWDIIWDFTKGEDIIELSYDGIANWDDLSKYISSDTDGSAEITFSEDDFISFGEAKPGAGVISAADLEASDFAFA